MGGADPPCYLPRDAKTTMTRPMFVELAGPAGSGKSSLAKALSAYDSRIRIESYPNVRELRDFPFFLWNSARLLPVATAVVRGSRGPRPITQQVAIMAILQGLPAGLSAANSRDGVIVLFDQGPVYMLSELLKYGSAALYDPSSTWWKRTCSEWANLLNTVVYLDAADDVLIQRVRARASRHGIRRNGDAWATQFLAESRQAQNKILDSMTCLNRDIQVLRIDTSRDDLAMSLQTTMAILNRKHSSAVIGNAIEAGE